MNKFRKQILKKINFIQVINNSYQSFYIVFYSLNYNTDSSKEKHLRSLLKSEVLKLITPKNVVILDALNYIKGISECH